MTRLPKRKAPPPQANPLHVRVILDEGQQVEYRGNLYTGYGLFEMDKGAFYESGLTPANQVMGASFAPLAHKKQVAPREVFNPSKSKEPQWT